MAINDHIRNTESMQYYPQPSMPEYSSNRMQDDRHMEGEAKDRGNALNDHIMSALWETLEEIDIKGKELLKIFSRGDVEIPLGRLVREVIGDLRAKDLLDIIKEKVGKKIKGYEKDEGVVAAERGLDIDEDLSEKLERFKVKTVNIGGVVKEEQK